MFKQWIYRIALLFIKHMFVLESFPCKYLVEVQWKGLL
jgi:hypothetical protein